MCGLIHLLNETLEILTWDLMLFLLVHFWKAVTAKGVENDHFARKTWPVAMPYERGSSQCFVPGPER